jgi:D-amino-acid dehydrogenase
MTAAQKTTPSCDVLVLGAGIVGITLALKLQSAGRRVVLLDRGEPGAATSFGNAGLIERSSVFPYAFPRDWRTLLDYALQRKTAARYHWRALPFISRWLWSYWRHSSAALYPAAVAGALPLVERSWSEHAPLIDAAGAGGLVNEYGWIKVFRSEASRAEALDLAERSRAYGLRVQVLTQAALQEREPALGDGVRGGVHYPDSRQVRDPQALSLAYLALFCQQGGRFVQGDARSLRRDGQWWCVDARAERISARDAVLTLGPWGEEFARQLGYRLQMGVKRGYHRHFAPGTHALRHVIVDVDHGYALAPMTRGLRLTTGAEFALRDAVPTPTQLQQLEPIARRLAGIGESIDAEPWMGSRPCTSDMLPVLGRAPQHPGLWFSFGHAHHGLTLAASSGRLLAEMICGQPTFTDPHPYRIDRF